ncbi:transcription factor bHLH30 isoform X2 [Cryptomeria japonica]|uniref:transcription factor bHLH30 isoform X2 n=1 Tax=Cryptomeria japonica TaxID=3369 RepID=UPI0025AB8907|nr:transcription factor bHLH30 isoform X2 [Cryptomeria japonica]
MAMFTGNPSLHKTMAELSFHQQFRKEQVLSSSGFSLPNSVSRFTDIPAGAFPFSYRRQSNLAVSYSNNNVPEVVDGSRFYPQYFAQNGGSLVLDCSRGELVNASKLTLKEISEAKALAASKSHSEAERRRRERINSHLATLKSLLPSITKTDKASLLAEAIKHVKDLKRRAAEFAKTGPLPMDVDELQVEEDAAAEEGRVKKVFHMTKSEEKSEENQEMVSINYIREALKAVIERATASGESSASPISNKRQRILPYDG